MKKLTIKLDYRDTISMYGWLDNAIQRIRPITCAEKCALATLVCWQVNKLHPKTLWYFPEKTSFKLDAQTAFALRFAITIYCPPVTTSLGNRLLMVSNTIDQHFQ